MDKTVLKVGFWSGLLAFFFTVAYCIAQVAQVAGIVHFPLDELLIYGTSLGIVIPFLLAVLALHYTTPVKKRFWSHAALILSTIYAVFVTANYVVQLASVIPSKLKGEGAALRILEQTPHSLFWDFDALGYIFMGLAMFMAIPAFGKKNFDKWVRTAFLANALVTPLISVVYFYPGYSEKLLVLGYPWAITAPLSILLLALWFKNRYKAQSTLTSHMDAKRIMMAEG